MGILKDIPELIKAKVITQETADRIQEYYKTKSSASTNRLFTVFGVLGAILVGLGIILILAHNWDQLSRTTKTFFAFLPLFIGQVLCGFALIKKQDSIAWTESSAAFLFFSVGASISLVSQVYHIPGNLSVFVLTWMLLCLPLLYVMKSSIVALLYLVGITYYACETSYWSYPSSESYLYWLLLSLAFPHYYLLYKKKPKSNFMVFHNWLIPLSVIITLGTVANRTEELMFIAYFSLFGILYLIGEQDFFLRQRSRNSGYKLLGALGTIVLLLTLSFDWFWEDLRNGDLQFNAVLSTPEFFASTLLSLLGLGLLYFHQKDKAPNKIKPLALVFLLFIIAFLLGRYSSIAVVLINVYVLAVGIFTIRNGAKQDHLGILNYGLLILTALVVCRFFDTDLSFVVRGIMFVSVGAGFFVANYLMLKKRKANES
ncbi:MAG: DUF2157 domain-containing protein [Bacteroidota bacterium]